MKHAQYGLTLRSILIVTVIVYFALYAGLKVFPMYQEYNAIKHSMQSLAKDLDTNANDEDPSTLEEMFMKRLNIDASRVRRDNITFQRIKDGWKMKVNYEILRKRIWNLDLIGVFNTEQDFTSRGIK
ncbi:MAG TPA: DUF4845 domain-containing protein [Xylella sp.]